MRQHLGILARAILITVAAGALGVAVNFFSPKGIPWIYTPPKEVAASSGRKIPIIDEKLARSSFNDGETIFVDARTEEEYHDAHIQNALSLPAEEKEERFVALQPLLFPDSRIIVYCSGPECQDAQTVAEFLDQMGYEKLAVMAAGFPAWKRAGYPIEGN